MSCGGLEVLFPGHVLLMVSERPIMIGRFFSGDILLHCLDWIG